MRIHLVLLTIFFITANIWSQKYDHVDKIIKSYPSSFNTVDEFARKIDYDFKLEEEKVRALYGWLSLNIFYDHQNDNFDIWNNLIAFYDEKDRRRTRRRKKLKRIEETLASKKAVCLGFSEIFTEVCDRIGIESQIVSGYSKTIISDIDNEKSYKDHAWNVVKINDTWKLIDVTWASVYLNETPKKLDEKLYDYYFFTNPDEFITTHFPANRRWQLIKHKLSKEDFLKKPLLYPNYFHDEVKIANFQNGVIEANKKRLFIYFDKVPEKKKIFYTLKGERRVKQLGFKETKEGKFITSIRYNKPHNSQIILYSGQLPIIGFKIKSSVRE